MNEWDANTFEDHLGNKVAYGLLTGRSYSGKRTVAGELVNTIKSKIINMEQIAGELKKSMGSEEEPFEGEVSVDKVEAAIVKHIANDRANSQKYTYLFDRWMHKSGSEFINFAYRNFGLPTFILNTTCDKKTAEERFKKKNETEEINEEAAAEIEESAKRAERQRVEIETALGAHKSKVRIISLNTNDSLETTSNNVKSLFSAKVIIVNHEKRLYVDTCCSNLAIKYNMLYLSVYQLIKAHILGDTEIGKALVATRKHKDLTKEVKSSKDSFQETEYSAVHFDMDLVFKLIQATIAEKRTS